MSGNAIFQVYLPIETYDQLKALCDQLNWTHGTLLGAMVHKCPSIEMRAATPPLHIKRSASPRLFKAHVDSSVYSRINHLCTYRDWSHRDMVIHLLDHYINTILNKEANHG